MTGESTGLSLIQGFRRSGLDLTELWLRQVAVGGIAGELELEAYLCAALLPDALQHDTIALALNEYLRESTAADPVRYAGD
jgi:hypothetical protein